MNDSNNITTPTSKIEAVQNKKVAQKLSQTF